MKKFIQFILLSALTIYSQTSFAEACTQNYNSLDGLVGLDSESGNIYASTSSSTNECSCTSVRFKEQNTDTKSALSILLTAKMADRKVRIDLLDKTKCDTAYRVYIH